MKKLSVFLMALLISLSAFAVMVNKKAAKPRYMIMGTQMDGFCRYALKVDALGNNHYTTIGYIDAEGGAMTGILWQGLEVEDLPPYLAKPAAELIRKGS